MRSDTSASDTDARYSELKKAIRHRLAGLGAAQEIHSTLVDLNASGQGGQMTPELMVELMQAKGLVAHLVKQIAPAADSLIQNADSMQSRSSPPAPG